MNVDKVTCTENAKPKQFQNNFQKQHINSHANFDVHKGKLKCYRCGNSLHLANSCKYINTFCNLCEKRDHLSKVFKSKSNNLKKQIMH